MSEFSVSRVTIRRALKELVNDALLAPRQGSGYKVQALLQQPLNRITGFSEDCRRRGLKPGSIWLSCEDVACDDDEATHFKLEPKTIVVRINRIRTADGEPYAVDNATLLRSAVAHPPWPHDSLYGALAQIDCAPVRVHQTYKPMLADRLLADWLDVEPGAALMRVIRAGYAASGAPVEYARCWFRPDRWEFSHEIHQ